MTTETVSYTCAQPSCWVCGMFEELCDSLQQTSVAFRNAHHEAERWRRAFRRRARNIGYLWCLLVMSALAWVVFLLPICGR
jgi:hypothetical protein